MSEDDPKQAVRQYVDDKLPFKSERELAKRLRILERLGSSIYRFESRFGWPARLFVWAIALGISIAVGYVWATNTLAEASVAAAISNDLEFVRYRGNGLSIVYDHNLNETGRVQLNLSFFYASRVGTSLIVAIVVFLIFRRSYVKAAECEEDALHPEES